MATNHPPVFPAGGKRTLPLSIGTRPASLDAFDADGDPIIYAIVDGQLPNGLVLGIDGTFSGAVLGLRGTWVTVRACDPSRACVTQTVQFFGAVLPETSISATPVVAVPVTNTAVLALVAFASAVVTLIAIGRPRTHRS